MANQTSENLVKAFVGEAQAYQRYTNFAKKAEQEGHKEIAKMFRAAAEGEKIHAGLHLTSAGAVQTTKENLEAAITGETEEFTHMYPEMIEAAKNDGNARAELHFTWANEVEKKHAAQYKKLLDKLGATEGEDYFVCQVCGNLEIGKIPDVCPVCGASSDQFIEIE